MRIPFIAVFILSFYNIQCIAQQDTLFIKGFHDKLIIKPYIGGPSYKLDFEPKNLPDSLQSSFEPNTFGIIGIDLSYKSLSISLSKRAGDLQDQRIYGKSKYTSFSAKFGFKKFTFEGYYKNYKGFADMKTQNYHRQDSIPFFTRNDLENKYYKLKVIYQFSNKKFSYPAAFSFTERQRKSAVALLLMGNFNRLFMKADSSFFPVPVRAYYDSLQYMKNLRVTGLGGAMGGAFNLVLRKFFFSGIVFLGIEFQDQKYFLTDVNDWRKHFTAAPVVDSRFSIGFSGNRAFIALTAKSDLNIINLPNFVATTTYSMVTLDFGYRFNAPKILVKSYAKVYRVIDKVL